MIKEMCLNQLTRPKMLIKIEGVGNCETCVNNDYNHECKRYVKISVIELDVSNKE
jgi:hypothetical protein